MENLEYLQERKERYVNKPTIWLVHKFDPFFVRDVLRRLLEHAKGRIISSEVFNKVITEELRNESKSLFNKKKSWFFKTHMLERVNRKKVYLTDLGLFLIHARREEFIKELSFWGLAYTNPLFLIINYVIRRKLESNIYEISPKDFFEIRDLTPNITGVWFEKNLFAFRETLCYFGLVEKHDRGRKLRLNFYKPNSISFLAALYLYFKNYSLKRLPLKDFYYDWESPRNIFLVSKDLAQEMLTSFMRKNWVVIEGKDLKQVGLLIDFQELLDIIKSG